MLRRSCVAAALASTLLAQAPGAAETQEPAGDDEADIISGAGKPEKPPPKKPSIVLDKSGPTVRWDPRWRKFGIADWVVSSTGVVAALGGLAIPASPGRWIARNDFDDEVRNGIRLDDLDDRNRARDASDVTLALSINQVLIDTVIVTWWGHDNGEVALQMALMNIEAVAINLGINSLVSAIASRQRPYATEGSSICVGVADENINDCRSKRRYRSFYSGHSSTTFTMAGLTCMHHSQLPLYGAAWAGTTACVGSFLVAGATGTLRIVSDQHWASDVLAGAALGSFNGLFWPWILHYRTGDVPDPKSKDALHWMLVPSPTGAHLIGSF